MPVPVTAVANGSIAWELLEDVKSHFDLVLTDVVMPCLSGVGLLSKMMKREACKRVPVVSKFYSLICLLRGMAFIPFQLFGIVLSVERILTKP